MSRRPLTTSCRFISRLTRHLLLGASLLLPLALTLILSTPGSSDATRSLRLPNGLRVIVKPSMSTDIVAIEMLLDISASDDPPDQRGLRNLLQRLLLRGTTSESGDSLARRLASVGGVAETTVGLDYVEIYAIAPSAGFETALEVIAQSVRFPAFGADDFANQRTAAAEAALAARDDPFQETYLAFREALYGDHPYSELTLGSPSSLSRVSRDDVVAFHAGSYLPNRCVIAICGGVSRARALAAVKRALGDWVPGPAPVRREMPPVSLSDSDVTVRERPTKRAHLMIGFPAAPAGGSDYYAAQVIDSILGGVTGRLARRLRDELGLVYEVSSFYPTLAGESHLVVYGVTEPGQLGVLKAAVLQLLSGLAESPVPEAEFARAKAYLLGSYALSHERMKDQAYALAWYEILGVGVDFDAEYRRKIAAVTSADVQQAARRLCRHYVLAAVLPEG